MIPGRLRQKPLQPLDLTVLGAADRLGPGQPGQRLIAIAGQQQALQVVAEAAALGQAGEQEVEPLRVGLQRAGRGWQGRRALIGGSGLLAADKTMNRTAEAYPKLNKLPLLALAL